MTSVAPQRLLAVEIDLDRKARELFALRDEIARLRTELAGPAARPTTAPSPLPTRWPELVPAPAESSARPSSPEGPAEPATEPVTGPAAEPAIPPWWRREGAVARVFSVVGAGVLLLGVTFLLVLAVQQGWFGPVARVVTGAVASVVLVGLGLLVHRRQADNPGGVALVGTGVTGAYLVLVALTVLYGWVGLPVGFGLAAVVCAGGVAVARRWDSQVLAVLVLLGVAALAPVVGADRLEVAAAFLVLVSVAAASALADRPWPVLQLVRVLPAAALLLVTEVLTDRTTDPVAAVTAGATAGAFAVVVVLTELRQLRRGAPSVAPSTRTAIVVLPALVAPLVAIGGWPATCWSAALAVVWLALATRARDTLPATVLVAAGAVALLLGVGSLRVEGSFVPSVLVVALVFVGAGLLRRDRAVGRVGLVLGGCGVLGLLPVAVSLLDTELRPVTGWDLVTSTAAVGLAALTRSYLRLEAPRRTVALDAALLVVALVGVVGICVTAGSLLGGVPADPTSGEASVGFLAGHAVATSIWMAVAAWLLLGTVGRPDPARQRTAVALTALAVAKLLLFDLATLDGLIRVGVFVVVGAALLALGTRYARSGATAR